MSRLKCKQKLCGFPDDKNSKRKKVLIREFFKKNAQSDSRKEKVDPRIVNRRSLIEPRNTLRLIEPWNTLRMTNVYILYHMFTKYLMNWVPEFSQRKKKNDYCVLYHIFTKYLINSKSNLSGSKVKQNFIFQYISVIKDVRSVFRSLWNICILKLFGKTRFEKLKAVYFFA